MSDITRTMMILLLLTAGTATVALIFLAVMQFINRIRKAKIDELRQKNAELRNINRVQAVTIGNLTNECIVVRGVNMTVTAENEQLAKENGKLMEGTPVVHAFVGMRIKEA